jgi:hypothetical protein
MAAADLASKGTAIDSQGSIDPQGSIYLPLDPSKAEIRLLILHPGSIAVPITCHLTVVPLRQRDLDYEALSYCWVILQILKPLHYKIDHFPFVATSSELYAGFGRPSKSPALSGRTPNAFIPIDPESNT